MKPNMLFIGSKQIDYVQYDEASGQLYIHYATGRTDAYCSVSRIGMSSCSIPRIAMTMSFS